ncbi:MAG TPA: hypothetical protein VFQ38_11485 [Longimicrobiales bacterium]|nr:hypothetical protein [Longimicrobiales bacterium]
MNAILRRALLLAPLSSTLACYTYAPMDIGDVAAGAPVRARVSGAGADQISAVVPLSGRVVDGHLVERDSASILLQVPSARRDGVPGLQVLYQRVRVPRADVLELESRRLDPVRTGLIAVGGTALAAFIASRVLKGNEPGVPRTGGPGGTELTSGARRGVPLGLRVPLP